MTQPTAASVMRSSGLGSCAGPYCAMDAPAKLWGCSTSRPQTKAHAPRALTEERDRAGGCSHGPDAECTANVIITPCNQSCWSCLAHMRSSMWWVSPLLHIPSQGASSALHRHVTRVHVRSVGRWSMHANEPCHLRQGRSTALWQQDADRWGRPQSAVIYDTKKKQTRRAWFVCQSVRVGGVGDESERSERGPFKGRGHPAPPRAHDLRQHEQGRAGLRTPSGCPSPRASDKHQS